MTEVEAARERYVDQVLSGTVRKLGAPAKVLNTPEPSTHPDERMNWTLKDLAIKEA